MMHNSYDVDITMGAGHFKIMYQLILCNDAVVNKLYFFIADEIVHFAQPVLFYGQGKLR